MEITQSPEDVTWLLILVPWIAFLVRGLHSKYLIRGQYLVIGEGLNLACFIGVFWEYKGHSWY